MAATIRAAGGVVWRVQDGTTEIAVVHRPRYDDWSLPKGKLEDGESELAAAVREVGEEIGSTVAVSRRLRRIGYVVGDAPKTVAFWLMRHVSGEFRASEEVDEVRWLDPAAAATLLTHDIEREVLAESLSLPWPEAVIVLVRHAKAGKRSEWYGDDAQRPLEQAGLEQARRLVDFLGHFGRPDVIVSASPVRCVQTVEPFAASRGASVTVDPVFSDEDYELAPDAARRAFLNLARPGTVSVVSSQGTTIPGLVESLGPGITDGTTKKGAAWVFTVVDGDVCSADYYPHAARKPDVR